MSDARATRVTRASSFPSVRDIPRAVSSRRWLWLAGLVSLVGPSWLAATPARADGPYEGQWREGPMNIRVSVESWGGDCGPRPQSTTTRGGGAFRISQQGDQLTFHLRQARTTRECWSENRAVRRVSSSYQAGTWRIVCRTPASDSRAETGTYTIQAVGDDRLQFRDVSRYDWQLNESSCVGTITTTQTFTRIGGGATEPEEPPEEPSTPRCTPGAAARVVLRPASADVQPGGRQCFTARVVDSRGCALPRRPSVRLAEGEGSVSGLCYEAPDAATSARIVASSGALTAEARVAVRTMDLSDLIARRTESGSVGGGTPEDASSETAARVSATQRDDGPGLLWPALALVAALVLVGIAFLLLRRKKAPTRARKASIGGLPGVVIPDDEPEPEPETTVAAPTAVAGDDMICPSCRRGYPPGTETCPHDETRLMPYREFAAGKAAGVDSHVCPTCGERYPPTVKFCGKDGTTLVPG